jgi:hypothetical protein
LYFFSYSNACKHKDAPFTFSLFFPILGEKLFCKCVFWKIRPPPPSLLGDGRGGGDTEYHLVQQEGEGGVIEKGEVYAKGRKAPRG